MTIRQQVLKFIYPLFIFYRKLIAKKKIVGNKTDSKPSVSFYSLPLMLNNGKNFDLEELRGKKILLVNTASNCGFTPQYTELENLYQLAGDHLEIIAFPSNDFKQQEKGSDEEIMNFCTTNFNIHFPVAKKSSVIKGPDQNPIFQWLTAKSKNGWNGKLPSWNFSKYLINEEGMLTHYFEPSVSPMSKEVVEVVNSQ